MATPSSIDSRLYRKALGAFATGVTIVTSRGPGGQDAGLTANSFNSASLDPPMVLWSLGKRASTVQVFMEAGHFSVHVLAAGQEELARRFATSGIDRFAGMQPQRGPGGVPLLEGCAARFDCRTSYRYEGGDHVIFVGEVLSFADFGREPLVFQGGGFAKVLKDACAGAAAEVGGDFLGFLLRRAYAQMMLPLRSDLTRLGLAEVHRHILSILSMGDPRDEHEIVSLLELTGHAAGPAEVDALARQGLVEVRPGPGGRKVSFTSAGRECANRQVAACRAAEADATRSLSPVEARLLKALLNRLIQDTADGVPESWHREHYWLETNLWQPRLEPSP